MHACISETYGVMLCLLLFYLTLVLTSHNLQPQNIQLSLLENIPFCNNPAELTDLETYFMWTQTSQLITLSQKKMDNRKTILQNCSVACEVCVNLNHSTEVHFTLVYWFKSRTWQSKSNRACAKVTWKPGNMHMAAEREATVYVTVSTV